MMKNRCFIFGSIFSLALLTAIYLIVSQGVSQAHERVFLPMLSRDITPVASPTSVKDATAHLLIPSIKVNAPIEAVGTNPDDSLAVPDVNPWTTVGLYADGPYPGEQGSAVIDGHLDRPGGFPAVFWNLHLLHKGDIVKVTTPGQPTVQFRVTQVASYTPASAPLSAIFDKTNGHFLNLVTCSGRWIPTIHQTTRRLVVYTTMIL